MSKIEQVSAWKATDGSLHETESDAVLRTRVVAISDVIKAAFPVKTDTHVLHPNGAIYFMATDIAKALIKAGYREPNP